MIESKKMEYNKLKFLSERQLVEHTTLYNGYVNKINEIRTKLQNADLNTTNATLSDLRSLKIAETFALNGTKLHEGYFKVMGKMTEPSGKILEMINKNFGSYGKFNDEFKATALAVRGWVVLAYDLDYKELKIFGSDAHDNGAVWGCMPLLILDVYEHAYFMDYGTSRKKYVESFMETIDWDSINMSINGLLEK